MAPKNKARGCVKGYKNTQHPEQNKIYSSDIQSKIVKNAKYQEKIIHTREKRSTETDPAMIQMMELVEKVLNIVYN